MSEETIFVAALEKSTAAERAAYLEEACAADLELRLRVEALLRAHEQSGDLLDPPAHDPGPSTHLDIGPVAGWPSGLISEAPGLRIGPYRLLRPIGEGGMGVVFAAEQEMPVRRKVALKVIKPGMDTAQVVARFEAERQALALMDHDHIAKVFDAGMTEGGRPFFVMELVDGVPITEYCDRHRATPNQRLELFVTVCQAIQHAHQKGIIHRDIKPSNVLVTLRDGKPVPKVIDFGVAKATEQRLTEKTLFTAYGQMVGTPAYMSPEQASMSPLDVDTRSDIYSLGVLLYELLTGTTPIEASRLREAGFSEIQRLVCDVEPPRPSTRLSSLGESATILAGNRATNPRHLSRMLAGDLDWIVMKAIEKDRDRRFASPGTLAEDVRRYLRREAILARPPSAAYRLTKFAQRHRNAVLAAATMAAALLAGTAIATWQAVVATEAKHAAVASEAAERRAKQTAEARETEARAVLGFLENQLLAAARPRGRDGGLGPDVTLRAAIDAAVPFVEASFQDQPLTEARLRMTLGNSYWYLGDGKAAAAQYGPARAIRTRLLGPDHPDTIDCIIQLGISYDLQGRIRESVDLYEAILPICKAKFGPDARQTLRSMNNLAMGLYVMDRLEEAMNIHREVLAISRAKYGPDDRSTLITMINLANVYHALILYQDSLKLREETVELFKARYGPDDPDALMAMHNLGDSLHALGRYAEALRVDEETRSRRIAVLGVDHPDTLMSLWAVARDLIRLKRGAEAVPILDECLQRAVGKFVHPYFKQVADFRLRFFQKAKDPAECRKTAELWEKQRRTDAMSLYQAAVCRAVTAAVLDEVMAPGTERAGVAKEEEDRAIDWLIKAVAAGYDDLDAIKTDKDLDTLRGRAGFRKLLTELEAKPREPEK
jgi:eukaryotic-like serine/threonine-protein kinase